MNCNELTKKQLLLLNNLIEEIIFNNDKCQSCKLCYGKSCFFGFECLTNNFKFFLDTTENK